MGDFTLLGVKAKEARDCIQARLNFPLLSGEGQPYKQTPSIYILHLLSQSRSRLHV